MRIRKGKRCLPLAPADRSFMQEPRGRGAVDGKDCADQALMHLVAAVPRGGGIIGSGAQYLVLLMIVVVTLLALVSRDVCGSVEFCETVLTLEALEALNCNSARLVAQFYY